MWVVESPKSGISDKFVVYYNMQILHHNFNQANPWRLVPLQNKPTQNDKGSLHYAHWKDTSQQDRGWAVCRITVYLGFSWNEFPNIQQKSNMFTDEKPTHTKGLDWVGETDKRTLSSILVCTFTYVYFFFTLHHHHIFLFRIKCVVIVISEIPLFFTTSINFVNYKTNLLIYFVLNVVKCIYNEWKGLFGWTSDLRAIFARSWRQQESTSLRKVMDA